MQNRVLHPVYITSVLVSVTVLFHVHSNIPYHVVGDAFARHTIKPMT